MKPTCAATFVLCTMLVASPAFSDEVVDEYNAFIGQDDLYNSNNVRLTEPWQIIRQDRANFHRFGISQRGDENDRFFAAEANRALVERMLANGGIDRAAAIAVVRGNVMINVRILHGRRGDYVDVAVF